MDWNAFLENMAQSSIESGINATYQFALSSGTYRKQKKLLEKQAALQKDYYNLQNQRQDYLLANADLIRKRSLDRAGYSTADPQGTGTIPAQSMQVPSVSTPGHSMPTINASSIRDIASSDLAESQAKYYEVMAGKESTQNELLKLELQKFKDTYETQVQQVEAEFNKTLAETSLNQQQKFTLVEQAKKLQADAANIELDTQFNKATFDKRREMLNKEVAKLAAEGKFEAVKAKLAESGIVVGLDTFGQIAALALSGKASGTFDAIQNFIKGIFKGVPEFIIELFDSFTEGISNMMPGENLQKVGPAILEKFPFLKHFFKVAE